MLRFAADAVLLCFTVASAVNGWPVRRCPPPARRCRSDALELAGACDAQSHSRASGEAQGEDLALAVGLPRSLAMHSICISH